MTQQGVLFVHGQEGMPNLMETFIVKLALYFIDFYIVPMERNIKTTNFKRRNKVHQVSHEFRIQRKKMLIKQQCGQGIPA